MMRYEGTKIYMRKSTPLGLDIFRKTTDLREPPPRTFSNAEGDFYKDLALSRKCVA